MVWRTLSTVWQDTYTGTPIRNYARQPIGAIGAGSFPFPIIEYIALNNIPDKYLPFTLLLAPTVSRWMMVYAIFAFPYARPEGLGKAFKQAVGSQRISYCHFPHLVISCYTISNSRTGNSGSHLDNSYFRGALY